MTYLTYNKDPQDTLFLVFVTFLFPKINIHPILKQNRTLRNSIQILVETSHLPIHHPLNT